MGKCKHKVLCVGCKSCKSLQDKWYGKLKKDTDFEDIEDTNRPIPALKKWAADIFRGKVQSEIDARSNYFIEARALVHTFEFDSEMHKKIWALHAEGKSQREIAKTLYRYKISKSEIDRILRNIRLAAVELRGGV